jgi:hypothetical protein
VSLWTLFGEIKHSSFKCIAIGVGKVGTHNDDQSNRCFATRRRRRWRWLKILKIQPVMLKIFLDESAYTEK